MQAPAIPQDQLVAEAARRGFPEYCVTIDPKYRLEWFHMEIALKLEEAVKRVEQGEDVRIAIFMPPRHGKSDTATQKFPSWVLGKHPDWPFIVSSYSQDLATAFGQGTRDLMDSENYAAIFDTRMRSDTKAKANWQTEQGGGYTAVGVGGTITGKGFKIGIIDDPFKNREEADSEVIRESVHRWYRSTFYTRQEGNTAIILILTRWHDDDLAGRVLKEEIDQLAMGEEGVDHWEVLEFKAIATQDEPHRKEGDPLWPHKFDLPKLMRTKAALGGYEWSALYQQNPIDEENQELKREWLRYRTQKEVDLMTTRKFATIDPAGGKESKGKKKSDNTGVTRNYVNEDNEWHLKSKNYRINSKGVIDLIFELHEEGMETIGIEEGIYTQAIEPFLKIEMEARGIYPNVVGLKHNQTMKETRIRGLIPRYENGKVYHIENTCADLEEEYLRFPKGAHDDALDSVAYQSQIAAPPSQGIGDRITRAELEKNVVDVVNDQSGTIIIGISTAFPVRYVIGNKHGVFFQRTSDAKDPYAEIATFMARWKQVFVLADTVGDLTGVQRLEQSNAGHVFTAYMTHDPKSKETVRWGSSDKYGDVQVGWNAAIQQLVEELRDERVVFNGTLEDWDEVIDEWTNLYRVWETNAVGDKTSTWESSGPQHFMKALVLWRVGMEKFSDTQATVVDAGNVFDQIESAQVFPQS